MVRRRQGLFIAAIAVAAVLAAAGCGDGESGVIGSHSLTDLGGDDRPRDIRAAVDTATGDIRTTGDTRTTDAVTPPPDLGLALDFGPPPDTGISLAPDCPQTGDGWSAWFSKPTNPDAMPGGPVACGGVRLDRALAWVLRQATTSIDVALYSLDAKEVGDALLAAHAAGVAVRVIIDDENGAGSPGSRIGSLLEAGVEVRDDRNTNKLMHHKFAIIDGARVWLGSANASTHDGAANANNSLVFDSAALAAIYADEFYGLWTGGFHDDKGDGHSLTLAGSPAEVFFSPGRDGAVEDELLRLIRGADHEIFVSLFAFTRQRLADALADRCHEIDVIVLLDQQAYDGRETATLSFCPAGTVLADEVPITSGMDWPLTLHHKYMIVDGRYPDSDPTIVTGSMNWSQNGLFNNDEATLVWHDADAASVFVQEFAARVEEADGLLPAS